MQNKAVHTEGQLSLETNSLTNPTTQCQREAFGMLCSAEGCSLWYTMCQKKGNRGKEMGKTEGKKSTQWNERGEDVENQHSAETF